LLDALPERLSGTEHLDIVAASTIMPVADWHHYQCFYEILELATSIKPACFLQVLASGCETAIYLDADIQLFKPLDRVLSAIADGHEVVLTPHILTPLPADGRLPDDLAIMRAGIYNLGFAAFANTERSRAALRWWERHLRTLGLADLEAGLFTDQKWIDFIPAFVPTTSVIRDPGYNAAYWNLHERIVRETDDGWRVLFSDGTEFDLTFFHFSGFSPSVDILSKHDSRFRAQPPGDTRRLLAHYAAGLNAADVNGFAARAVAAPRFENGAAWDPVCRALYRSILAITPSFGDPLSGNAFLRLAATNDIGDHLPRYLRTLLDLRPDIAQAFDDGRKLKSLAAWLFNDGASQIDIDPALLRYLGIDRPRLSQINYVGYFQSHLGVAEAARNAVTALGAAELDVAIHDISRLAESPTGSYAFAHRATSGASNAITILGVNADQTPTVLGRLPADLRSSFLIGYWAWETPDFPEEWCDRFDLVDEVWVASSFAAEAVRAKATVPVFVAPYPVSPPRLKPDRPWLVEIQPEIRPDEFVFLFLFDIASVPFRKNPDGAIAAFKMAFRPDEPVRLVIKTLNGHRDPELLKSLEDMAAGHRVTIWDRALETQDRFRLLASVDAFVSLHRAEGFGLSIAEAMAFGLPVVTTGWSGNVDFTNAENSASVAYDLKPIDRQHGPYPAGTLWAEPRLDDAARHMRRIRDDAAWRERIGAAAARTIASQLSPETIGAQMKARIERLSRSMRTAHHAPVDKVAVRDGSPRVLLTSAAFGLVASDVMRRPFFYIQRIPRMPRLLIQEGFGSAFGRVARSARGQQGELPGIVSLRSIVLKFTRLLRKLGIGGGEKNIWRQP